MLNRVQKCGEVTESPSEARFEELVAIDGLQFRRVRASARPARVRSGGGRLVCRDWEPRASLIHIRAPSSHESPLSKSEARELGVQVRARASALQLGPRLTAKAAPTETAAVRTAAAGRATAAEGSATVADGSAAAVAVCSAIAAGRRGAGLELLVPPGTTATEITSTPTSEGSDRSA